MSLYALELNDADFVAWDVSRERLRDSGHAFVGADGWRFGAAAAAGARLHPHATLTSQWADLDAPSIGAMPFAAAEAVYRQMLTWREALGADRGIWLASPASSQAQLGLLLGIAQAAGLAVAVLADRAAAAVSALPVAGTVYHLDVELERGVLSEVQVHAGRAARHRVLALPELGQRPLLTSWCKGFAARMVAQTRFDPLHDAATEQALFDALPSWLAQLQRIESIPEAAVEAHGRRYAIEYRAAHAAVDVAAAYRTLTARLHALRPARRAASILLSATAARLPGILEALSEFNDCPLFTANTGQAAQAALGIWDEVQLRDPVQMLLLSLPHTPYEAWLPARTAAAPDAVSAATHVVFAGRALALSSEPLLVGTATDAARSLAVPASVAGVSRRHCSLLLEGGQAFVVDHSRFGSFLNEERVPARALLRVGDRLRLGNPGVELSFVRME
ncbi:MAG: FHA domain-containing protein [Proteobacteria bacterium]|nr:FHA domain-containing protein [Pseudomonadota bacterium]